MSAITESPYKGSGQLTRQQFLFYEMRTTAKLMDSGLTDEEIVEQILSENLYQYPTEKTIKQIARGCVQRLHALEDLTLVSAIANQNTDTAKQICMYAMMKQYRLVWDFMITVIGAKYREQDFSYGRIDLNVFFMRIQEQDDEVATWSDSTVDKIKQVLNKVLVENEYIDGPRASKLNPVMICSEVENAIRANGDEVALPAFNCFY